MIVIEQFHSIIAVGWCCDGGGGVDDGKTDNGGDKSSIEQIAGSIWEKKRLCRFIVDYFTITNI